MPKQLILIALIGAIMAVGWVACDHQDDDSGLLSDPKYEGWKFFRHANVKIFYPPGHPQEPNFQHVAEGYVKARRGICQVLNMPELEDTLTVLFYTGWGQGREMTGQRYPHADSLYVHFWIPSHFGPTFTAWLLPKWSETGTIHRFLYQGLLTLFDHSGKDYHRMTLDFVDKDNFMSLSDLAVDTLIDSNEERYQSAEAASFIAFFIAWYGPDRFKSVYETRVPLADYTQDSMGLDLDSMEYIWLNVIRANLPDTTS